MKVYILFEYDYDYCPILGVYDDEEKAKKALTILEEPQVGVKRGVKKTYGYEEYVLNKDD